MIYYYHIKQIAALKRLRESIEIVVIDIGNIC